MWTNMQYHWFVVDPVDLGLKPMNNNNHWLIDFRSNPCSRWTPLGIFLIFLALSLPFYFSDSQKPVSFIQFAKFKVCVNSFFWGPAINETFLSLAKIPKKFHIDRKAGKCMPFCCARGIYQNGFIPKIYAIVTTQRVDWELNLWMLLKCRYC